MVKSGGGQRESEGAVVPLIGVQHNAPGGKGPHFDRACGEGKRQGMAGTARPDYPGGLASVVAGGVPPPVPGIGRANLWVPKTCVTWADALRSTVGLVQRSALAGPGVG